MHRFNRHLPVLVIAIITLLMLLHGPILQPPHYHHFADTRPLSGLSNAADVLSNLGFAIVGIWGLLRLSSARHPAIDAGWPGYRLFLYALIATAAGSAFYHLQPDNLRLVWDRIPIALACAGLLDGVYRETRKERTCPHSTALLAMAGILSVVWWYVSEQLGKGDLRPYLLLQALPLVLIPLWQWMHDAARADRQAFTIAILLYIAAKLTELNDHEVLMVTGWISGHTIKHLLATVAAAAITIRLVRRTKQPRDVLSQSSFAPSIPSS